MRFVCEREKSKGRERSVLRSLPFFYPNKSVEYPPGATDVPE